MESQILIFWYLNDMSVVNTHLSHWFISLGSGRIRSAVLPKAMGSSFMANEDVHRVPYFKSLFRKFYTCKCVFYTI